MESSEEKKKRVEIDSRENYQANFNRIFEKCPNAVHVSAFFSLT